MNGEGSATLAHVLGQLDFGGVETMAARLIGHMPGAGLLHLMIVTGRVDPARREWLQAQAPVTVEQCPYVGRRRIRFIRELSAQLARHRPDAVLCYSFGNHLMVSLACRLAGVRRMYVRVAGSPLRSTQAKVKNMILAHLARPFCAGEIAVSHAVARELTGGLKLPPRRVHVIPNGCAVDRRSDATPSFDSAMSRVLRLLMVSRMDDAKDPATALRAVALLREAGRAVSLALVGDGPLRGRLETLAEKTGVSEWVSFEGKRSDVAELMGRHDMLLHCTFSEGFPNVLIEAMAAGIPIVASDIPPCREVLDDGRCGLLVPPSDPLALGNAIESLAAEPETIRRQTQAARDFVARHYRIESCARRYAELLTPGFR